MAIGNRCAAFAAGMLVACVCLGPAVADETDIFVGRARGEAATPNVLLIFDTSGSMDTIVESQSTYDPTIVYDGACSSSRLYWRSSTGDPPSCSTDRWIAASALRCKAAEAAFASSGRFTDRFARFDANDAEWKSLNDSVHNQMVECEDDGGHHGDGTNSSEVYARNGVADSPWSERPEDEINWEIRNTVTIYTANYLNWYHGPTRRSTRMQVMKDVAKGLVGSVNGVHLGVMRYNSSNGGSLVHEIADVARHRGTLLAAIDSLSPSGFTPLAETLYEAALYFLGREPHFGETGVGIVGGRYRSPVQYACQKNYIVYLTDGEPNRDEDVPDLVGNLPGFASVVGSSCSGSREGACLVELARYLHEADLDPSLPGKQNVSTYTIGFTLDLPLMSRAAQAGGGEYFTTNDTASLAQVLTNIVTSILETPATLTAPAVAVNAFNRTQHSNDIFVTLFQPTSAMHWPGNLKKYRLRAADGVIVDVNGRPVVDETGFISPDAQSAWSPRPDGRSVTQGGAASRLPAPAQRRIFTYLSGADLTAPTNEVARSNSLLTDAVLGLGDPDDPSRDEVID
ncbi:MAG: VWA domain-containing protein, partial [Gammaproteobacteria bacterium]